MKNTRMVLTGGMLLALAACTTAPQTSRNSTQGESRPEIDPQVSWVEFDTDRQPASNCNAEKFVVNVRQSCSMSNNDERRIRQNADYCKTFQTSRGTYNIATMRDSGDVVVLSQTTCSRRKYRVDNSGIDELKISGGFSYMRSRDGQLYIIDAKGIVFEIRSNSGNPYSRSRNSAVVDIKGGDGNRAILVTLQNGQTFDLNPDEVVRNPNRYREVEFYHVAANGSLYND